MRILDRTILVEPPRGIEPLTYSLRVANSPCRIVTTSAAWSGFRQFRGCKGLIRVLDSADELSVVCDHDVTKAPRKRLVHYCVVPWILTRSPRGVAATCVD